jgi:TPR repeat protein
MSSLLFATLFGLIGCQNEAAEALKTCDGGNIEACYRDGLRQIAPPRPSFGDARVSFSKACMTHHAPSCMELAKLVRDAKGGPQDLHRAAELFGIACEKWQEPEACVDLALAVYEGKGTKEDPERAVQLLNKACTLDEPIMRACSTLADAYADGKGVERKDPKKATVLYDKACDADYAPACVALGDRIMAERGRRDLASAASHYGRACKIDARLGCYELASLHAEGKWDDASDALASEFFQKTCNIDPTRGCYEAAELMAAGKVKAREGEIEYLYNLACEYGSAEACAKRQIDRSP